MRGYTTLLTGWVASIIGFDAVWIYSKMDVIECLFVGLMVGIAAAIAFIFLTDSLMEKKTARRRRPEYIRDEATGIEYMPMKHGKVVR